MIPKKIVTTFARRGKAASFTKPLNLPCQGTIACIIFNRTLCIPGGDNHNQFPPPKGRSDAIVGSRQEGRRPVESLWTEVKDENSGLTYWWNEETDETTEVGAAKPMTYSISQDPWIEVKDPQTDQIYYWNQITDETTAIGEPKPDPTYGRQHVDMGHNQSMADGLKQSMV
mmetsp:Transcript_16851/g.27403  ORF Transcript_16851/g.27403 Transcript_16851/m.27403 type:complete len:171 (+) Transcript_16851:89-601(+)